MATVFSTNVNVVTFPDVSPLEHLVISWAWRNPAVPESVQKAAMVEETKVSMRRFPDAASIAHAYHRGKVLLPKAGLRDRLKAAMWVLRRVRSSDRVLISAPLGGADRVMWLITFLAATTLRKPLILYLDGFWVEPPGTRYWLNRRLQRMIRSRASKILVPARLHRDRLVATGLDPQRIEQIESIYGPRVRPVELLPIRARDTSQPLTLLHVGRMLPYKGLDRLLTIADRMLREGSDFRLVVVVGRAEQYMGSDPGYVDRCLRLAAAIPPDRIELHDHSTDIDLFYRRADALVMPNVIVPDKVPAEAWGRVVEEALHHNLPIVSTDAVPAALECIEDGVNGLIVPWESDEHLQAALMRLITEAPVEPLDSARGTTSATEGWNTPPDE